MALRIDVLRLYRIYQVKCFGEIFDLVSAVEFSNRTVRHSFKYHPLQLDTWQFTTVRKIERKLGANSLLVYFYLHTCRCMLLIKKKYI